MTMRIATTIASVNIALISMPRYHGADCMAYRTQTSSKPFSAPVLPS
jgi:hypothetical protein